MFKGCALYLNATVDVEDKPLNESPTGWLGIDLRVVNPAVTSDGETLPRPIRPSGPKGQPDHPDRQGSGPPVNFVCYKDLKLPSKLQQQRNALCQAVLIKELPTSDPRKKPGSQRRESSDLQDHACRGTPHRTPNRQRATRWHPRPARSPKPLPLALHSWSFYHLGSALDYKAQRAGVPVVPTPLPTPPIAARDVGTSTGRTSQSGRLPMHQVRLARTGRPERSHQHRHARSDDWAMSRCHRTGRVDHGTVFLRGPHFGESERPAGTR